MVRPSMCSFVVFVFIVLANGQGVWGQTVRAYVDRNPISMDETVRLVVEQQGQSSGDSPDLSPLKKDFDVLGTSHNSQTSIINGQTSISTQWVSTLAPKHVGKVIIPPLNVGGQASEPLALIVQQQTQGEQGTTGKDIFLEATVEPNDTFVQSQIVYTLRLFHAVTLQEGQIEDPQIHQAIVERIGEDRSFDTIRSGRRYQVIERRYLVVPQASGSLKIPSVLFSGRVPDSRGRRSLFDDMYGNRPGVFGGSFQSTRLVRVRSPEITLKVQEIPPEMRNGTWLPARELSLTETWSPDDKEVQVGVPMTRTITIHAKGLTGEQLPELPIHEDPHVKIYPDQATTTTNFDGSWAVGTREQKLALVPTQAGKIDIPGVRIRWWNLETHQPEEAVLPARTLTVMSMASVDEEKVNLGKATGSSYTIAGDSTLPKNSTHAPSSLFRTQWPLMAGLLLVMWVLTILGWWYDRKKLHAHLNTLSGQDDEQKLRSLRAERESVKKACWANSPKQTREALLKWASVNWHGSSQRNLGSIAQSFVNHEERQSPAREAIWSLDRNLYAAPSEEWDGKKFWEIVAPAMKKLEKSKETGSSQNDRTLAPLFLHSSS